MTQIELRTQSGRIRTINSDDPVFSPLLDPYRELEQDLPSSILLTGAISDAFEEEYHYYESLSEFITKNTFNKSYGMRRSTEMSFDTSRSLAEIATIDKYKKKDKIKSGPHFSPYLSDIRRLSRILNLPNGWQKYVPVNSRTPEEERLNHLYASGAAMAEVREGLPVATYISPEGDEGENTEQFALSFLAGMATTEINALVRYPEEERDRPIEVVRNIFFGIARNAILIAQYASEYKVEWNDVLWGDIRKLLERELGELGDRRSLRTADVLAGVEGSGFNDTYSLEGKMLNMYDKQKFYMRIISSLPRDVDPIRLGLGIIISDSKEYVEEASKISIYDNVLLSNLGEYPSLIHKAIFARRTNITRVNGDWIVTNEDLRKSTEGIIEDLLVIAGKKGLRFIYDSLVRYLDAHPDNERVINFNKRLSIRKYPE